MDRKKGLDFLKLLCCIMVIFLHIEFPNVLGLTEPVCRVAVPVFFMITGWFYSNTKEKGKELQQIKKIAMIFLWANLFFMMYGILEYRMRGDSAAYYLQNIFTPYRMYKFIVLNASPFKEHLWYLGAALYTLVLVSAFEKKADRKRLYPLIPLLLAVNLVLGRYSILVLGRNIPRVYSRNFVFTALPFFLLGDMLYTYKPAVKAPVLVVGAAVFSVLPMAELLLLKRLNATGEGDLYISTLFCAVCLFMLAANYGDSIGGKLYDICCFTGARLSLGIYILHLIFIRLFTTAAVTAMDGEALTDIFYYILPVLVFIASAAAAWLIYVVSQKLKNN